MKPSPTKSYLSILRMILILFPLVLTAKEASVTQLFSVQTVKVKKVNSSQHTSNYGYVVADESRMYDISPRFGGYVLELYADTLYKKVKKGEALARVYSPEVFKAKDEYINTYKYTKKRPDKSMLESARLKLELLGISKGEIKKALINTEEETYTTIYSPVDGYIFSKGISKGGAFNAKSKLFMIVNLDEVWVEAKLFEEERASLEKTQKFELSFKGLSKVYTTSRRYLYPQLDPKAATLTLRLHVKNDKHELFPGMYAKVKSVREAQEYLSLPSTAVMRKNGKYYIFIVGEFEGEYEPLEISASVFDADTYIVKEGLDEGDEVVNNALFMMDSDAQINGLY